MNCRSHATEAATANCTHCGAPLCNDCQVNTRGSVFCRPCLAVLAGNAPEMHHMPGGPDRIIPPPPGYSYGKRHILWGLLFMFSILPGANYMYMGLMRRGLATLCGFFLIIFMLSGAFFPINLLLGLSIPILYVGTTFDAFNIRRRINAGEVVPDDVGAVIRYILANKNMRTIILVFLVVVLALNVLNVAMAIIGRVLPVAIIALGCYLLVKRNPPNE